MKIVIQESADKKPRIIRIPTRGLLTGLGPIVIGAASIASPETGISYRQARILCRALLKGRKVLNGEPLVEVEDSEGQRVVIYL